MVTIAERITRWRSSREGLTKAALARAIGTSAEAVVQWESGKYKPTIENIEKVADAIGVSLSVFWGEPPASPRKRRKRS